jgi:hypothetical protein
MNIEDIQRRRMHGLFLSRKCDDIVELSRELLGMHCWFHRNVAFSALIRGADISGWKTDLIKTWLYRGTLHGAAFDDLPAMLALHGGEDSWLSQYFSASLVETVADEVLRLMEDGVNSRAQMRKIFAEQYDEDVVKAMFSPWGGIFVTLARQGRVAFRDMTSRDFDLIDAVPSKTADQVLPDLLRRYFTAYGPATLEDAAWFFGYMSFYNKSKQQLKQLDLDEYIRTETDGKVYYSVDENTDMGDIPELTLLSGFDPIIVSYVERGAVLPAEYKKRVILSSGICLPTVAVNGKIAGLWNIKKNQVTTEFFTPQPEHIRRKTQELAEEIKWRTAGKI